MGNCRLSRLLQAPPQRANPAVTALPGIPAPLRLTDEELEHFLESFGWGMDGLRISSPQAAVAPPPPPDVPNPAGAPAPEFRTDGGELGLVYTVAMIQGIPHCRTHVGSYSVDGEWMRTHPHLWQEESDVEGPPSSLPQAAAHPPRSSYSSDDDPKYKVACPECGKVLGPMVGIFCLEKNGEEKTTCDRCGHYLMDYKGWIDIDALTDEEPDEADPPPPPPPPPPGPPPPAGEPIVLTDEEKAYVSARRQSGSQKASQGEAAALAAAAKAKLKWANAGGPYQAHPDISDQERRLNVEGVTHSHRTHHTHITHTSHTHRYRVPALTAGDRSGRFGQVCKRYERSAEGRHRPRQANDSCGRVRPHRRNPRPTSFRHFRGAGPS